MSCNINVIINGSYDYLNHGGYSSYMRITRGILLCLLLAEEAEERSIGEKENSWAFLILCQSSIPVQHLSFHLPFTALPLLHFARRPTKAIFPAVSILLTLVECFTPQSNVCTAPNSSVLSMRQSLNKESRADWMNVLDRNKRNTYLQFPACIRRSLLGLPSHNERKNRRLQ